MQHVKLTLANDKHMLMQLGSIQILESVTQTERGLENVGPKAYTAVRFVEDNDFCDLVLVQDKFGYLQRMLGGNNVQLTGPGGKRFSLGRHLIASAMEVEGEEGEALTRLKTHARGPNGPIVFLVTESVDEIIDTLGIETPVMENDNGYCTQENDA